RTRGAIPNHPPVCAGAGLGPAPFAHEMARRAVGRSLRHERPFQPGRDPRPAAAAQAGGLHLGDDPVAALVDDRFRAVPGAAGPRAFEAPIVEAIEIPEDAVLVVEHDLSTLSVSGR